MVGVVTSGTDINERVTVPADITFQITNDEVALEAEEMFPVVVIPDDPTVTVEEPQTDIVIRDDFDSMCVYIMCGIHWSGTVSFLLKQHTLSAVLVLEWKTPRCAYKPKPFVWMFSWYFGCTY